MNKHTDADRAADAERRAFLDAFDARQAAREIKAKPSGDPTLGDAWWDAARKIASKSPTDDLVDHAKKWLPKKES